MAFLDFIVSFLGNYFLNPFGVFSLLGLLLIWIAYLLKPKIKTKKLPSMIFLMQKRAKKSRFSLFRFLPSNWLLYYHLLIGLLVCLAIMNPYIFQTESSTKDHIIHVIDVSASMQSGNRFNDAKISALDNVGKSNTVVLVSSNPYVALEKASASKTKQFIRSLKAAETRTPLIVALQLVDRISNGNSAIHIYSDMSDTSSTSSKISSVINKLETNDNTVVLHSFTRGIKNVGFIDADINEKNITLSVKNYQDEGVDLVVTDGTIRSNLRVAANDISTISFATPNSPTVIKLDYTDDLSVDNTYYFAPLPDVSYPTLYITNDVNPYLETALGLFDFIDMTTYIPPGISRAGDFEIFILENLDTSKVLPGTITKALKQVKDGGILFFKMSDGMDSIDLSDVFGDREISDKKLSKVSLRENDLTVGLTASSQELTYSIKPGPESTIIMENADSEPVIIWEPYGDGYVLYYGIDDSYHKTQFSLTYAYPILLKRTLASGLNYPDLFDLNRKTGSVLYGKGVVRIPGNIKANLPTIMSKQGFYENKDMIIATNILSDEESKIDTGSSLSSSDEEFGALGEVYVKTGMAHILAIIAGLLFAFEVIILKWRGEL